MKTHKDRAEEWNYFNIPYAPQIFFLSPQLSEKGHLK